MGAAKQAWAFYRARQERDVASWSRMGTWDRSRLCLVAVNVEEVPTAEGERGLHIGNEKHQLGHLGKLHGNDYRRL